MHKNWVLKWKYKAYIYNKDMMGSGNFRGKIQ